MYEEFVVPYIIAPLWIVYVILVATWYVWIPFAVLIVIVKVWQMIRSK